MEAAEVSRAVAAATSIAEGLGLPAGDASVLHNSNKLAVRLLPCDVFARIGPAGEELAEFEAGLRNTAGFADVLKQGLIKREYRDHRLEWMVKSGGIDIVAEGLKNKNIRFSWPHPLEKL